MRSIPNHELRHDQLYIACEQFDFDWLFPAVELFDRLWIRGKNLSQIAKTLKRDETEVFLLYIDRVSKKKIKANTRQALNL
jgi:hypothetical protein